MHRTLCAMPRDRVGASYIGTFACRTSRATPKQAKEPKIRVPYSNSITMEKDKIVLATLTNGQHLTVSDIKLLIERNDRKALADFIYNRLYGRYLKPYDYDSDAYRKYYKNGFAIMGSSCLLIESYVSFSEAKFRKTKDLSRQCFGHFFTTEKRFKEFAAGGRQKDGTISTKKQGGTPNEFYDNVRCGILHNGETRNGWTISRNPKKPLFNRVTKEINAVKFANNMKAILKSYKLKLQSTNPPDTELWPTFLNRLNDLIETV